MSEAGGLAATLGEIDWRPVWISLRVATAATFISVILGALLGYGLSRRRLPARRLVQAFVLLPLLLPPTVLGYYLLVIIGREGPVGRIWESFFGAPLVFTPSAAVLAACVATIPIVTAQLSAAFATVDREVVEAAKLAGAGAWPLFLNIYVPQIRGPLTAAASIAFARAVGDFGTTLMVAGSLPGRTQTASLAIYDLIAEGKQSHALVLVVLISVVALVVLVLASGRREAV